MTGVEMFFVGMARRRDDSPDGYDCYIDVSPAIGTFALRMNLPTDPLGRTAPHREGQRPLTDKDPSPSLSGWGLSFLGQLLGNKLGPNSPKQFEEHNDDPCGRNQQERVRSNILRRYATVDMQSVAQESGYHNGSQHHKDGGFEPRVEPV